MTKILPQCSFCGEEESDKVIYMDVDSPRLLQQEIHLDTDCTGCDQAVKALSLHAQFTFYKVSIIVIYLYNIYIRA